MRKDKKPDLCFGRKPVLEALSRGAVSKLLLSKSLQGPIVKRVLDLAKQHKIQFVWVDRKKLDGATGGAHQGMVGYINQVQLSDFNELIDEAVRLKDRGSGLIFLDEIQDPGNIGSILRSAVFFGARGVVLAKWRTAALTAAVVKSSAGAVHHIPISQVANLATAIDHAKKAGIWFAGATMEGEDVRKINIHRPFGIVLGSEGGGLRPIIKKKCDFLVGIKGFPSRSGIDSLNVGVACGIMLQQLS